MDRSWGGGIQRLLTSGERKLDSAAYESVSGADRRERMTCLDADT